ncbi:cytochrome d ubiquinol oxidase subunit II [Niabella yanshanensis]|uniref:Cytochrome d ubiquinol oxidase subunit II n=1 Tax=Niabella yanshanensis TaxID=577386 RepID=A0ABZ0W9Z4_9BACT|nr:cytochrome d ubiquinol oxidase subunit II [Niabella yanshanensis]WQD39961.1 cytochrome d ubiquinol oxidase subunit II [Niabella yanshanensis]
MIYVVMAYLWASVLLYVLMGGADFGAGVLEFLSTSKSKDSTRKVMYRAIGPIWEANHMWLIIAIVILFVGFPVIYTTMSVYLHIPLTIMLLGIIARGTAFTFRNYDAVKDKMQVVYSKTFMYSSIITPLFLGIIAGSAVSGRIDPGAANFLDAYIFSWLAPFPVAVGIFTVTICGFLAAIFIIGETRSEEDTKRFVTKSKHMSIAALAAAALVFIAARVEDIPLEHWLFGNPVSIICVILAIISLVWMWASLFTRQTKLIRVIAGAQVSLLLVAITYEHYPVLVNLKNTEGLSLLAQQGAEKTIRALGIALLAGSVLILPSLFYLLYSFSNRAEE